MLSNDAILARAGNGLIVVATLVLFVAMFGGDIVPPKKGLAKAIKNRNRTERWTFLKEGRALISGLLVIGSILNFVTATFWVVGNLTDMVNASMHELFCMSWMVVSSRRWGLTRFRLNAWLCLVCAPLAIHMVCVWQSVSMLFFGGMLLGFALEPAIVGNISIVFFCMFWFFDNGHLTAWERMLFAGCLLLVPPIVSLIYSQILSMIALKLNCLEESGEALFALLSARYDAVVELDKEALIVNASETFFGIADALPPADLEETVDALLQIPSVKDNTALSISSSSGHDSCLLGLSLKDMLPSDDDRQKLMSCLQEQRSLWEVQHGQILDGTDAQKRHASAVHICMRTQAGTDVELRLYCAVCCDVKVRALRFFIGICREGNPPRVPDARLVAPTEPTPVLSTTSVKFNAAVYDMLVMEPGVLRGNIVPTGTPVIDLLPTAFKNKFDIFVQNMLQDAVVGERRAFQSVSYKDARGLRVVDEFSVEITRDTRDRQHRFKLEMMLILTSRPDVRRKKKRSSSSSNFSSSILPSVGEGGLDSDDVEDIEGNAESDEGPRSDRQPHPEANNANLDEETPTVHETLAGVSALSAVQLSL